MRQKTSLWALGLSPLVWSLHFLFSYVLAAVWCARFVGRFGDLQKVRIGITVATVLSVVIVGAQFFSAYRRHRMGGSPPPHDKATHEDTERFLGLARSLIASLSLVGILYTAYVAWFLGSCL